MAGDGMDRIKHLVVVMMENRSFDSLLGFLYADVNNRPPINIPAASSSPTNSRPSTQKSGKASSVEGNFSGIKGGPGGSSS